MQQDRSIRVIELKRIAAPWIFTVVRRFFSKRSSETADLTISEIRHEIAEHLRQKTTEQHTVELGKWDRSRVPSELYKEYRAASLRSIGGRASIVLIVGAVALLTWLTARNSALIPTSISSTAIHLTPLLAFYTFLAVLVLMGLIAKELVELPYIKKQALAPRAQDVLQTDKRLPVLLIRSFLDDDAPIVTEHVVATREGTHTYYTESRFEEAITPTLSQIGPVVTVGNPRDNLPDLGAARARFADSEWKEPVLCLIDQSRLIVLVCGPAKTSCEQQITSMQKGELLSALDLTPGVRWEVEHILETGRGAKLLVLLKPLSSSELSRSQSARILRFLFGSERQIRLEDMVALYAGSDASISLLKAPAALHSCDDYCNAINVAFFDMTRSSRGGAEIAASTHRSANEKPSASSFSA